MWRDKLTRMMDELPEKYLQAGQSDPEELSLIPSGSKPVSQLTEEEKRLDGVYRQLWDMALLEADAHKALYGEDESKHPLEACRKHNQQMVIRDQEIQLVIGILMRSLKERLGLENEYVIDHHDIYVVSPDPITLMVQDIGDDEPMPDDMGIPGFRGWPEIKH